MYSGLDCQALILDPQLHLSAAADPQRLDERLLIYYRLFLQTKYLTSIPQQLTITTCFFKVPALAHAPSSRMWSRHTAHPLHSKGHEEWERYEKLRS